MLLVKKRFAKRRAVNGLLFFIFESAR